jgi:hypothetical protein
MGVCSPEKAGVGGSTPSLATILLNNLRTSELPSLGAIGCNSACHCIVQAFRGFVAVLRNSMSLPIAAFDFGSSAFISTVKRAHLFRIDVERLVSSDLKLH